MTPKFFPTQSNFRRWLEENHDQETEIIVGYYNVKSGKGGMTWSESVDQALCFGWIDGVRRKIDEEIYCNCLLKKFSDEFEKRFSANKKAWEFFVKQANWYKKQMMGWVMTAKQEATREKRLAKLIEESANERRF